MSRTRLGAAVLGATLALGASAEPAGLAECTARPRDTLRSACFESLLSALPSRVEQIDLLERLLSDEPAEAERLAQLLLRGENGRVERARLLDVRGQALVRLGSGDDAADAFLESVAQDDGTTRLGWVREDGLLLWTAGLDPGAGRLERAARSLLAAGRKNEASRMLERALAAGAGGWAVEAWKTLGAGAMPGRVETPASLSAQPWFPLLPDIEVKRLDGGTYPLASARGKVMLLEFWASWCAPCIRELPHVQEYYKARRKDGFDVLAVNARETDAAARSAVRGLGLEFPIGLYDEEADRAFRVRALPTLILVDRQGRIRARWDEQVPDFEGEVVPRLDELLAEGSGATPRILGEILFGTEALRGDWVRDLSRTVAGLAVAAPAGAPAWIAVASGDRLLAIRGDGSATRSIRVEGSAGRLCSQPDGSGIASFHPGGEEYRLVRPDRGSADRIPTGSAVFEMAALPAGGGFALATLEGLSLVQVDGTRKHRTQASGEVRDVAVAGSGPEARIVTLAPGGVLGWFLPSGEPGARAEAPPGSWSLVTSPRVTTAVGTAPRSVLAVATGSFWGDGTSQAALATSAGQLVVVDLDSGTVRFRALWEEITDLAAGDLDGDGRDELIVSAGRSVALLKTRSESVPAPAG